MARRPKTPEPPRKHLLSPDWREDGKWRITAMLARIPQDEYLSEARAFELHHISNQTMSDDWPQLWHDWVFGKLTGRPVVPVPIETAPKRRNLFA